MPSVDMRNAIEVALRNSITYRDANHMARDAFLVARCNSNSTQCDVDIRIHWNWFIHGWNAAHIWFNTITQSGAN